MIPVTRYFGSVPKPNATTSAGAIATIGVTISTIISGISARSKIGSSTISTASRNAAAIPPPPPIAISRSVVRKLTQ